MPTGAIPLRLSTAYSHCASAEQSGLEANVPDIDVPENEYALEAQYEAKIAWTSPLSLSGALISIASASVI